MKIVSDGYKAIAESLDGSARYYHQILVDGVELTDTIVEFKYSHTCNNSTNFSVGNTASAMVELKIDEPSIDLENKEIEVNQGLKLADGSMEYVKLGIFKVLSPEIERFQGSYQCVDAMTYKMSTKYESQLTYPTTDLDVLEEVCAQTGIGLVNSDLTSHTVPKKLENYTKREIIGIIAQLQGKNAIINAHGNLEFIWYTQTDYVVDDNRIYSDRTDIIKNENDYVLGHIKSTYGSKEIVSGDINKQGIKINNPYMTQDILDEVFNKIKGLTFRAINVDFYGDFRLEVGDIVTVNTNNESYIVPVMALEQSSDGGVVTTIESIGETATQNSVDTNGGILNEIKRSVVNSETARSIAEQAADKISFVVEGDSVSEFTVTENVIQATTEKLVIKTEKGGEVVIKDGVMYVDDIFAEEITATGSITGAKLIGATGEFEGDIASYGTITFYSGYLKYNPDGSREYVKDAGALKLFAEGTVATAGAFPTDMHLFITSNMDEDHKTYIDLTEKNVLVLKPQNEDGSGGAEIVFGLNDFITTPHTKLIIVPNFIYKDAPLGEWTEAGYPSPYTERLMADKIAVEDAYLENITTVNPLTVNASSYFALELKRLNSPYNVGIKFENQNGVLGCLVISAVDGKFQRMLGSDTSKVYDLIDASGGTFIGNVNIGDTGAAGWTSLLIQNSLRKLHFAINTSGQGGIYDSTNRKWLFFSDATGNLTVNGEVTIPNLKKDTDTHVVVASSTGKLAVSTVTSTALYYIRNLTGDLQEQLDNRLTLSGGGKVNAPVSTQTLTPTANSTSTTTGHTLGTSSYKWRYLYAFSSSIQTSDRNYKHRIDYEDVQKLDKFFDVLKPCSYYMIGGDRKHLGFIAQDVEQAMQDNGMTIDDLSFVCKDAEYTLKDEEKPDTEENREYTLDEDGNQKYIYGLKYTELHAIEIDQIQRLKTRVSDLEFALSQALARIDALESKLS